MKPFSPAEIIRRQRKAQGLMESMGVDALLVNSYASMYYLSGAPIHQFGRPAALLLTSDGEAVFVCSILERRHIELQSPVQAMLTYTDHNLDNSYENPVGPPVSFARLVAQAAEERSLTASRIGYEDNEMPAGRLAMLREGLPRVEFVGMSDPIDRLRMVLSDEELTLLRAADAIADAGEFALLENLHPGSTNDELVEVCRRAMLDVVEREHPDKPYMFQVNTGLRTEDQYAGHCDWTFRGPGVVAQKGKLYFNYFSAFLWGYWGNVERTVALGKPDAAMMQELEVLSEANEAAIAAVRPGEPLADVDRAAKAVLERHGYERSSIGTGMGRGLVSWEGDARHLPMDVRLYSTTIMEPGMVFSIEPFVGAIAPVRRTYLNANTIIVTDQGAEVDSRVPRGILWVDA